MTAPAFRRPRSVAVVEESSGHQEAVYLAPLPDGPIVVLRHTALTIWREAVSPSGQGSLHSRVARAYGVTEQEVRTAVEDCIVDLIERGVLEPETPA